MSQQQHLSADLLADLLEGGLPAADQMSANAHLVECAECATLRDALLDVTALLAEEGAVGWEMPADVSASLDAALTRASRERAAGVVTLDPERRRLPNGPMRWLAGAAAAVAIAGIGVAGWQAVGDGGSTVNAGIARGPEHSANHGQAAGGVEPGAGPSTMMTGGDAYGLIPVVRPARVSAFAQALVDRPARRVPPARFHCATPINGGPSTVVYWHGHPAVLVVNPATQTATILDCASAVHPLYSSGY